MELSLSNIVTILIFFQATLFAIYLITLKSYNNTPNRILALLLLIMGANIAEGILYKSFYLQHPEFAFFINSTVALHPALIYLYVRFLVYPKEKITLKSLLHLLFFGIVVLWSIFNYHILPSDEKLLILTTGEGLNPIHEVILAVAFHLILVGYMISTFRLIFRYNKLVKENYSEASRMNNAWLNQFVIGFLIQAILIFAENIIENTFSKEVYNVALLIIMIFNLIFINWIIYKALKVPKVFQGLEEDILLAKEFDEIELTSKDKVALNELELYMNNFKPFLDSTLSLSDLASKLNMESRQLSILINRHLNQNFVDYINTFRIDFAQQLLENPEYIKHTILEIMYESGFNSKSSFNTIFKKKTGLSPTQYRKNNLQID